MRITTRGIGLLGAAVALLGLGFGLAYAELAVLGGTALCALGFAAGYVGWRPRLAVVRSVDPDRVMRGEASQVTLTVSNASRLRAATLLAYDRCGARTVGVPLLRLRAGKETTVHYPVPTERRGVVGVGPLRVVRRDPLALLTMPRAHGGIDQVWVYPRIHPISAVPAGVVRSLDGLVDRVPHGSITFDTLREYVIGDELRHVHWRTTARVGELMVREHLDTSLPRLVILLDDRTAGYPPRASGPTGSSIRASGPTGSSVGASGPTGSAGSAAGVWNEAFEAACEAAASILVAAVREELPVTLRLVLGAPVDAGDRRERTTRPFLDALAEAQLASGPAEDHQRRSTRARSPDRTPPLELAVANLRHRRAGDTLIFLTGSTAAEDLGLITTLRGGYQSIVVGILGSDEPVPPAAEGILVLTAPDGAGFAAAWDGTRPC